MAVAEIAAQIGPSWGWLVFLVWGAYQLYWPFQTTKLQQYHEDFTHRLQRIEMTQIALSEEVAGVNEKQIKEIHGEKGLSVSDLKE